jgi:hypothetical protein
LRIANNQEEKLNVKLGNIHIIIEESKPVFVEFKIEPSLSSAVATQQPLNWQLMALLLARNHQNHSFQLDFSRRLLVVAVGYRVLPFSFQFVTILHFRLSSTIELLQF